MSVTRLPNPRNWRSFLVVLAMLVLVIASVLILDKFMRERAVAQEGSLARNDAAVLSSGLQAELDKFNLVPLVLAEDPQVSALLSGDGDGAGQMNRRLEALARQTNAAAIYLVDQKGDTLAASNWQLPTSFVGSNYRFRQYFQSAIQDGAATQFALGTVSRRPGLYVARRVGPADAPLGIVALKIEFDALEATWRDATQGVFVTDSDGVVVLASEPDWRFKSTNPAISSARDAQADMRQFGVTELEQLSIGPANGLGEVVASPLLEAEQPIALDGWELHLLVDPSPRVEAAIAQGRLFLVAALALIALALATWLYLRRQRRLSAEAVLSEKTRTLREQLTQANRLAVLGQISAGVGHEINQPVAAARIFAENGNRLIDAGKHKEAGSNFDKIVALTEKIGLITGELRNFSRRQAAAPTMIKVGQALDGALLLLGDRIESLGMVMSLPSKTQCEVMVRAEHVMLEQVLVNLLQNAMDATGPGGKISITIEADQDNCHLALRDNGPGISEAQGAQVFQPFATTKEDGLGLGLVISRDIMRDLGGELSWSSSDQGACFTMRIACK